MILKEVIRLRDHTRYFVMANGHADAMSAQVGGGATSPPPQEFGVPDGLKELLDEIAHEEGFEERLKQEVWDDAHARNVSTRKVGWYQRLLMYDITRRLFYLVLRVSIHCGCTELR